MNPKRLRKSWWLWLVLGIAGLWLLASALTGDSPYKKVSTAQALQAISSGQVTKAVQHDKEQYIDLDLKTKVDGSDKISASYPAEASADIYDALLKNVPPSGADGGYNTTVSEPNPWLGVLGSLLPLLLIGALLFWVMTQVQGGGNRVMSFGRSKAKLVNKDTPKTTFADVAGADEAVEELHEIKDFLQNPTRYQLLGAKIPKGVLLYGPPGTGKTLLARAVAGEAGVPFYSISGSDFVEMFVGVGASRVRDLFEQAKENAPAIIFVDEIDAVGRHRGAGMGGGHDEREQTLNQMLVEMDGFDVKGGVILIAATNRPDILDPALLRPGRFDRQIAVGAPDIEGRKAVLEVHAKGKPFAPDVDLSVIARRTPGFTGADLANVINEAALLTARADGRLITGLSLEEAIDRVMAGPERKTRAMSDKEKRVTAYHEAGHALTAWAMPNLDPVHKLTILPRGRSLGHTLVLPLEDRYTQTRSEMLDQLVYGLGGRAAEELVFHEPTTGASNDIEKATALARSMVTQYGMSSKLGAVKYGTGDAEPFMGRDYGHQRDYSEEIASEIDIEVRDLIEAAHDEAWEILVQYREQLDQMVLELVERETLNKADLERILAPVRKRPPHNTFNGFGKRTPSDKPPVEIPTREELAARNVGAYQGLNHSGATNGVTSGSYSSNVTPNGSTPPPAPHYASQPPPLNAPPPASFPPPANLPPPGGYAPPPNPYAPPSSYPSGQSAPPPPYSSSGPYTGQHAGGQYSPSAPPPPADAAPYSLPVDAYRPTADEAPYAPPTYRVAGDAPTPQPGASPVDPDDNDRPASGTTEGDNGSSEWR